MSGLSPSYQLWRLEEWFSLNTLYFVLYIYLFLVPVWIPLDLILSVMNTCIYVVSRVQVVTNIGWKHVNSRSRSPLSPERVTQWCSLTPKATRLIDWRTINKDSSCGALKSVFDALGYIIVTNYGYIPGLPKAPFWSLHNNKSCRKIQTYFLSIIIRQMSRLLSSFLLIKGFMQTSYMIIAPTLSFWYVQF